MECSICKNGHTKPGKVTVTLERDNTIVLLKDVPAEVCQNCGHYYLDSATTKLVMDKAQEAYDKGAELEVVKLNVA
ncbi:YgiT-type zinc finger domain-containing protein [Aquiflexum balticum DSM 16537]|jgi:YgiT-type zinc finger domain-containing protein|uniref:YgiT-type zinc finger domain-containing protein n=1 Tax=Aquiflexum balticum DSM 16537 TaxID=758820 RepID=A0A1W2HB91_9BACT|nr:type II toxin-antitoxin system MqsA family antitoxin [Aquiflexum balticum]SMD46074.1 YgiT-type zinc finger domain-containing protein [Aquiflexum balticum DSM 16537]